MMRYNTCSLGPQRVPSLLWDGGKLFRSSAKVSSGRRRGWRRRGLADMSAGTARKAEGGLLLKGCNPLILHYNASFPQNRKPVLYSGQRKSRGVGVVMQKSQNPKLVSLGNHVSPRKLQSMVATVTVLYRLSISNQQQKMNKPSNIYICIHDFCSKLLCDLGSR